MSENYVISIQVEGKDAGASSTLDGVGSSLQRVGEFVVGGLIIGGLQKIGEAFLSLGKSAIESVSNVQMLEKQMSSLLAQNLMYERQADGTYKKVMEFGAASQIAAGQTEDMLKFVEKLAITSPFKTSDVENITKIAITSGMATKEVKDFTKAFLDVAAMKGITDIGFAATQFLQLKQAGALTTIDLRQLARMGIDVSRIVGTDLSGSLEDAEKRFGTLSPAAKKVFSGMDLDIKSFNALAAESPEVIDAIFQKFMLLGEEGAAGAAQSMAGSISGMMSTASDIVELGSRKLFRPIFEAISPPIQAALGKISDLVTSDKVVAIGEGIGDAISKGIEFFQKLFNVLEAGGDPLTAIRIAIAGLVPPEVESAIGKIISGFRSVLNLLAPLGTAFMTALDAFNNLMEGDISGFFTKISAALSAAMIAIGNIFSQLWSFAQPYLQAFFSNLLIWFTSQDWAGIIKQVFNGIVGLGETAWGIVWPALQTLYTNISTWFATQDWQAIGASVVAAFGNMFGPDAAAGAQTVIDALGKVGEAITIAFGFLEEHKETVINVLIAVGAALAAAGIAAEFAAIGTAVATAIPLIVAAIGALFTPLTLLIGFVALVAIAWTEDWLGIRTAIEPIILWFLDAIKRLPETLAIWKNNLETLPLVVSTIWNNIKESFSDAFNSIVTSITEAKDSIVMAWEDIKNGIAEKFDEITTSIIEKAQSIYDSITGKFTEIKDSVASTWEEIKQTILNIVVSMFDSIGIDFFEFMARWRVMWEDVKLIAGAVWDNISAYIGEKIAGIILIIAGIAVTLYTIWENIKLAVSTAWDAIALYISTKWTEISTSVSTAVTTLQTNLAMWWDRIALAVSEKWEAIKLAITTKWDEIVAGITEKVDAILAIFAPKMDEAKTNLETKTGEIKTALETKWVEIKTMISTKIDEIVVAITDKAIALLEAGKSIVMGIVQGIQLTGGAIVDAIMGAIEAAIDSAKKRLGISLPSIVMANPIGKPMAKGVGLGWINQMESLNWLIGDSLQSAIPAQNNASTTHNKFDLAVSVENTEQAQEVIDNFAFRKAWAR